MRETPNGVKYSQYYYYERLRQEAHWSIPTSKTKSLLPCVIHFLILATAYEVQGKYCNAAGNGEFSTKISYGRTLGNEKVDKLCPYTQSVVAYNVPRFVTSFRKYYD